MVKEETMTPKERVLSAVNLEKPDRVPIVPLFDIPAAATFLNLELGDLHSDLEKGIDAIIKVFDDLGGWDGYNMVPLTEINYNSGGLKVKVPGKHLPNNYQLQFDEKEWLKYEDYKKIADMGWKKFIKEEFIFRISDFKTPEEFRKAKADFLSIAFKAQIKWNKRKIGLNLATTFNHPFFILSLSRSLIKFTEDLYYRPEMVEPALEVMMDEYIEEGIKTSKRTGNKFVFIPEERAEAFFYPLKIFERFWWPYTKKLIDAWHPKGIIPWFHLDQCWDKNIPYFKELPKGSAILDFDGLTDIFAAKKVLENHLCIMSDVHPTLLSLGTPKDVADYCKKLIDKLGVDGGHLLGSGCQVPPNCKYENFKAMIETGKTYQLSK